MAVDWVGPKPGVFVNNSTITPIDETNMNAIVNTIDAIAQGGVDSGVDAETLQGIDLDALNTPTDEYLQNFYSFDSIIGSASENLLDDSGANNIGTSYNISKVKGIVGMAGSFNGVDSYASAPYTNFTECTLSLWFKGTTTGSNLPLFLVKRANNATKIGIYINTGQAQCKFTNSDNVAQTISGTVINDGTFHQIAVTHTGNSAKIYIDGKLIESINQSLTSLYYNELIIGAGDAVIPVVFTEGIIDDVRLYNKAFTSNEIYGQYFTKISTKVCITSNTNVPNSHVFRDENGDFSAGTITATLNGNAATASTATDGVKLTTDQSIDDTKTFTSSPIVPTPEITDDSTKVASTAFVKDVVEPISLSSRVCDLDGNSTPDIPDDASGVTYLQDAWATTDSWIINRSSLSVSSGKLVVTATGAVSVAGRVITYPANSLYIARIKSASNDTTSVEVRSAGTVISTHTLTPGVWVNISTLLSSAGSSVNVSLYFNNTTTSGIIAYVDYVYIGTGAYSTKTIDKTGRNVFTNNGLTPVDSPFGKMLRGNGYQDMSTSNMIGKGGTVAVFFKRSVLNKFQTLFMADYYNNNGIGLTIDSSNVAIIGISNGTSLIETGSKVFNDTTEYHSIIFTSGGTVYYDGVLSSDTVPTVWGVYSDWLAISSGGDKWEPFIGDLLFRYDSRIWDATDAYRWHIDPTSVDSRPSASVPTPNAVMQWGSSPSGLYNPTDASGAGLTFTYSSQGRYEVKGNEVSVYFDVTWPTTSDTNSARLSVPFTNSSSYGDVDIATSNYGSVIGGLVINSSTSFKIYLKTALTELTNANLSGKRIIGKATYIKA